MLDLILVVDDTYEFHKENLRIFPNHYAPWLRYGGPNLVTKVQRNGLSLFPSHVLFHVIDDSGNDNNNNNDNNLPKMKYGVVDKKDLIRDLTEWDSLYLAGRLHKPTLPLIIQGNDEDNDEIPVAQMKNLNAATAAALLLSSPSSTESNSKSESNPPTSLSWSSFYQQISSLSYTGDFRMKVGGEDPQKISKLVQAPGQMKRFHSLYKPILSDLYQKAGVISTSTSTSMDNGGDSCIGGLEWDSNDPSTISYLQQQLPQSIQRRLGDSLSKNYNNRHDNVQVVLATMLAGIVSPGARNQSFKGIFTLGIRKSIQYAKAKLLKGRRGG